MSFWTYGLPAMSEAFMLGSATAVAFGWYWIRRGRVERHRRLMLLGSGLGAAFLITYLLKSFVVGDTTFGGPGHLRGPYLIFLAFHILVATVAGIMGVIALRRALNGRLEAHRRIAPATATLWFLAAGTGLVVFLMLYVVYPPGPTVRFW